MTQTEALKEYLLRLADSDMILGQRLCELCGKAPALEEEMALGFYSSRYTASKRKRTGTIKFRNNS